MKRGWKSQICELIIARINPDILSWLPPAEVWGEFACYRGISADEPLVFTSLVISRTFCAGDCVTWSLPRGCHSTG